MKLAALSITMLTLGAATLFASTSSLLESKDLTSRQGNSSMRAAGYGHMRGTVRQHTVLDSRSWLVQGEDGRWYDPVNLPDSLKAEGTRINFSFKEASNWGYTYAGGELIELTQVGRAK